MLACLVLTACNSAPKPPRAQKDLNAMIVETAAGYARPNVNGSREKAVTARNDALANIMAEPVFADWLCTVDGVLTKGGEGSSFTPEKIAILSLDCGGFTLKNLDTAISGTPDNAITEDNPLYPAITGLNQGDSVIVSGNFLKSPTKNTLWETSLTTAGAMRRPDFLVRFTAVGRP